MGVKLMTGATGEQNIEAADDRECLAGLTGLDSYVFDTRDKLKATLVNANTVTIGTGAGSMQGSRFRCPTTTTVTIKSGTQGQYRHDIIGLHFSRAASGKETLEFQVLTGTPASSEGAAKDPSYTVGNLLKGDANAFFPLYRVKLSGINASDPAPMFSVLTPLKALIEDATEVGPWVYLYGSGNTNYVKYRKNGRIVELYFNILKNDPGTWTAGKIDEGMCPSNGIAGACARADANSLFTNNVALYEVWDTGEVRFTATQQGTGGWRMIGYVSWPLASS